MFSTMLLQKDKEKTKLQQKKNWTRNPLNGDASFNRPSSNYRAK